MIKTIEIAPHIYAGELAAYLYNNCDFMVTEEEIRNIILSFFLNESE